MTKEQQSEFVKILQNHNIGFISEDIFLFIDKLIEDEKMLERENDKLQIKKILVKWREENIKADGAFFFHQLKLFLNS